MRTDFHGHDRRHNGKRRNALFGYDRHGDDRDHHGGQPAGTSPYTYQFQRAPSSGGVAGTYANVGMAGTSFKLFR